MNDLEDELKTIAILVLQTPVVAASKEQWQRNAERLSSRLQHPVALVSLTGESANQGAFQSVVEWYQAQGFQRFVVMPIGLEPFDWDELQSLFIWMQCLNSDVRVHVARAWTIKDWSDAICPAIDDALSVIPDAGEGTFAANKKGILLIANDGNARMAGGPDVGLELAAFAYHCQQAIEGVDIGYAFVSNQKPSLADAISRMDASRVNSVLILNWRMDLNDIANTISQVGSLHETPLTIDQEGFAWTWNRMSAVPPRTAPLVDHPSWLHVAVGIYLDALAMRSIERYFVVKRNDRSVQQNLGESEERLLRLGLLETEREMDAMLPSEYQGRTDKVSSQSMGTATLPSDGFGEVPWDKIWTSFCDLAMAGGPPHRGKLLEAVTAQDVIAKLPAYEAVVQEIRRGIEMVTGLQTLRAEALGWVGVVCDDEAMAIWLMRAIIVENVIVRREGRILFLPAGPEFRVKKEIKNVITSVSKTVHYWRAHLRLQ
jgi:sirohydrochlorin cobaltochelatase